MTDTTLWSVATGHGVTCIEELRLSADNALRENWEHGRALHTLIDALEGAPINEETREAFEGFAEEFADGCEDVLQSFDDSVSDLENCIENALENALIDLEDGPVTKNDLSRIRAALLDSVKVHKTHRKTIQDLHRNLLSVTSDLKDKLKENP